MGATVLLNFQKLALPQGLRQALDVEGDFQGFQRRFDLDAQHYPPSSITRARSGCPTMIICSSYLWATTATLGLMGGFAVMMFLDIAQG